VFLALYAVARAVLRWEARGKASARPDAPPQRSAS